MSIILPAKGNPLAIEGYEALVGDSDAMGVTGEIAEDMMGTTEGWLGMDDPVLAEERSQEGEEGFLIFEWLEGAGESELMLPESLL